MLSITNTNVSFIPDNILKILTNLNSLGINNNKLTNFPMVPEEKRSLMENIQAHGNPFHCTCLLMEFINIMTNVMKSQDYK